MIPLQDARAIVERHFRVYDAREEKVRGRTAAHLFFVMFPPEEFDRRYEAVREELRKRDPEALCFLRREGGEDVLFIAARPPAMPVRKGLHVALFLLTVLTLTLAGTWYWTGFHATDSTPGAADFRDPRNVWGGFLAFALPVLAVLGIHEMGHYIAARRHGLRATPPFFIPFPPLGGLPLGTLGAFISLRDPLPDRKVLFDVGASGPLAGFLVAVPVIVAGAWLTEASAHEVPDLHRPDILATVDAVSGGPGRADLRFPDGAGSHLMGFTAATDYGGRAEHALRASYVAPDGGRVTDTLEVRLRAGDSATYLLEVPEGATDVHVRVTWEDGLASFGDPLFVKVLELGFDHEGLMTHPTFVAGWVGLLVTGINLLPVSQLDGGHVARAVLGERMKYAAFAAVGFLVLLTVFFGSWALMAILIVLLGVHHPPPLNDRTPLDRKRVFVAWLVLLVLVLTFVPVPFRL